LNIKPILAIEPFVDDRRRRWGDDARRERRMLDDHGIGLDRRSWLVGNAGPVFGSQLG